MPEITHRYRAAEKALSAVRFNEHGTPDRQLPDCPRCEENELHIDVCGTSASCLLCNWRGTWDLTLDA